MWNGISGLIAEIKRCEDAGATTAAVAMAFVCIDTMAFLSMPTEQNKQGRADFIAWVDTYLKGHPEQPYEYRGIDVYGARCALLHAFSSETNFHEQNPDAKSFGYHNGGKHAFEPSIDERTVIIGMASFLNDVVCAVISFMDACREEPDLRTRVEERLPKVLQTFPIQAK